MGLEQIELDRVLTKTKPLRINPKIGAVVEKRHFEGIGTFYCVISGDLLLLKKLRDGRNKAEVYVIDDKGIAGTLGWLENAAKYAFGDVKLGSYPNPKDLLNPWINVMESNYTDFKKLEKII